MRSSYSAMLMGALLFGAAAAKEPAADSRYVNVSGRLENLFDYESTNAPDDLLGHGWMTSKFHVGRVLSVPRLPPAIKRTEERREGKEGVNDEIPGSPQPLKK